ncbi:MAG: winged helix-turn-helix domain-containing protein [Bacteroidota bacterium]
MRSLQVAAYFSNADVQRKLLLSRETASHSRWQIIYLIQIGKINSAGLVAPLVNLSIHSIYKIVEGYNHCGAEALPYKAKGGRRRSLLSLGKEAALANVIRVAVERKTGKTVSDVYLWDLLHRNGWKKKMPRPHHPKRSKEGQEAFKKNSPKTAVHLNSLSTNRAPK